jgi:hypothetical protein
MPPMLAGGYHAAMEESRPFWPPPAAGPVSLNLSDDPPLPRRVRWRSSAAWIGRRLPRVLVNTLLVLVIAGLLAACYAPVYFGAEPQDRSSRRGH